MAPKMLESVVIDRPEPTTRQRPQNMCMDKAYDFPEVRDLLEEYGYTAHTSCKEEKNPSAKRESLTTEPEDGS